MPGFDPRRIADLEERLAAPPEPQVGSMADLEMLADLYVQADSHVPALETIRRLLDLPQARSLSPSRRGALEAKAMGYLKEDDIIVFNPYELLHVAKVEARAMFDAGYRPPLRKPVTVVGRYGLGTGS